MSDTASSPHEAVIADLTLPQAHAAERTRPRAAVRVVEIDGIRGWASVSVVFFHALCEIMAVQFPVFRSAWVAPWLNGQRAVAVFFILSGDALSYPFFIRNDSNTLHRLFIQRYVRLTLPIGLSALTVYGLMKFGLVYHHQAAKLVQSPWLGGFLNFEPDLSRVLWFVLRDVYYPTEPWVAYNPVLWTMSRELYGSGVVLLICYIFPQLRRGWLCLLGLVAYLIVIDSWLAFFVGGVLFAWLRSAGHLGRLRRARGVQLAAALVPLTFYGVLGFSQVWAFEQRVEIPLITLLVLACYTNDWLRGLFSTGISRYLGELSFPLYLAHFPVLVSLYSYLLVGYYRPGAANANTVLFAIVTATFSACVLLAIVFRSFELRVAVPLQRRLLALLK